MRHQLQIPLYLAKLCAGPVADTAVAALAALCLLTSKRPKLGIAYKQPVTFAVSLANVTLLLSSVTNFTGRVAASVAATLALSMCSGVNVSRGNLLSYLHVVRAVNAAFDLTLLSLPAAAASALAHLFTAWQLLDDGAKAHAKRGLYDMFGVRGFALVMLGKRRPFAVEDIRDPAEEEEFYQKSKRLCDDRSKRPMVSELLLMEWRTTAVLMAIDTLFQITSNSRRLVLVALLTLVNRDSSELGMLEVGLLFAVWQLLVLRTPIRRHFYKLQSRVSKRKQELINSKVRAVYANSRRQTYGAWWLKSRVRELVNESESFMSVISMAVAQILNAWVTANKIGWRALVPVVVAFAHWLCSHLVTAKVEQLHEQNQVDAKPAFQGDFSSTLHNLRAVKFYAWEDIFGNDSAWSGVRRYKPPMVWRALQFGLDLVGCATAELSAALAITSYISTAGSISYLDVTLLMNSIGPLTSFTTTLAGLNKRLTDFKTTKAELQEFFDADSANYIDRSLATGELAVDLEECVFSWGADTYSLAPIALQIKAGDFVTVVGRVGSGKSSFLSAICGEMPLTGGRGCVYGRIGYVQQKPWIMNGTFRENVLMGADFDEAYFWQVVDACALAADVCLFPKGDLTMIGTNGVNLSGGQKVRLALARALYMRADIYVLDDLLSAVDPHVERHIVERVLAADGIIGQKTRILVTHAEHLVPLSDTVITFADSKMNVIRQTPLTLSTTSINPLDSAESMSGSSSSTACQESEAADNYSKPLEYRKIANTWLAIWRFIQLSGYGTVALVMGTQFAQTYALYYTESLRIGLMTDSDPATMTQSLKHYLLANALVSIARSQINRLESWLRRTVWSTRLQSKMCKQIRQLVLSMPLPLLESLPRSTMSDLYYQMSTNIAYSLPMVLCDFMVGTNLAAVSSIAQVVKTSPGLLLLCGPLVALNYLIERWYGDAQARLRKTRCNTTGLTRERFDNVIECNRPLLRVHGMTDVYLDKLRRLRSTELSFKSAIVGVQGSLSLLMTLCSEIIETAILGHKLYQRLFASIPILPGELDAETGLARALYSQIRGVVTQRGISDDAIDQLSRYISYLEDTPREQPRIVTDNRPQPSWPETGDIEFREYRLRYRPDLDPSLNKLSFVVRNREKIGVVGRTGAGKSSLTYALMRLVEADSGSIIIDGVDISTIGLHDLRSRISIIPQDPSLFMGTIRDNLDPAHQYTDDEVWAAIKACQIDDLLETPTVIFKAQNKSSSKGGKARKEKRQLWLEGTGLDKWVETRGANFSVGQQQLVSLCRALLWRRKILVLDEATANVDTRTDQIMQSVIRREFSECTVLTIAHRINTIMDSDRVLVMDQGSVAEFDTPGNLLARDSQFKRLVESMQLSKKQGQTAD